MTSPASTTAGVELDLELIEGWAERVIAAGRKGPWRVSDEGPPNHAWLADRDNYSLARLDLGSWRDDAVNAHIAGLSPDVVLALVAAARRAEAAEARVKVMEKAINWACGCDGEFERPEGGATYWWRSILTKLAGMTYDRKLHRYVALANAGGSHDG